MRNRNIFIINEFQLNENNENSIYTFMNFDLNVNDVRNELNDMLNNRRFNLFKK